MLNIDDFVQGLQKETEELYARAIVGYGFFNGSVRKLLDLSLVEKEALIKRIEETHHFEIETTNKYDTDNFVKYFGRMTIVVKIKPNED